MKKKHVIFLCVITAIVFSIISCFATNIIINSTTNGRIYVDTNKYDEFMRYYELDDIAKTIEEEYYTQVDLDTVISGALEGSVDILNDGYSKFYSSEDFSWFNNASDASYIGQGITLERDDKTGYMRVTNVYGGTAAYEANILKDDIITAIDGRDTRQIDIENAIARLRGQAGVKVTLTLLDENSETIDISFTRRSDDIQMVFDDMLTSSVGYISIIEFGANSASQFRDALQTLEDNQAKKLIIDVRNVCGGYISSALECADMFLDDGVIARQYDKNGQVSVWNADKSKAWDKSVVVLMNGNTAGCAEVFVAALKDNGAASLVGMPSAAKGYTTKYIKLTSYGDGVRLRTGGYTTPAGVDLAKQSLTPDVEAKDGFNEYNSDIAIISALKLLA